MSKRTYIRFTDRLTITHHHFNERDCGTLPMSPVDYEST